ncbi:MAG: vanadium-dependent haloperoxidase [Pirellulales bacterium]|nr:vanadium-dependent haloperoxidase [Pirellulales bacterium]
MKSVRCLLVLAMLCGAASARAQSVARQWDELLLDAIRHDTPRPTVHARNLFHTSAAMYDAWAAFDTTATGYLTHDHYAAPDIEAARQEAISFAAYRLLSERFAASPGAATILPSFDAEMDTLGYDRTFTSTVGNSPAAIGNRIAQQFIQYGLTDGSNEAGNYADTSGYTPVNPPLVVSSPGTTMNDPNRWQPLTIGPTTQKALTPHWGDVQGFGLPAAPPGGVHIDAGSPPQLGGAGDALFKQSALELIRYSSWLDPADPTTIDISPGAMFNNTLGTNDGTGHAFNPATGLPYGSNVVNRGDYGRVLAEFWADGPKSETPPGHWNTIFNDVSDNPLLSKQIGGTGPVVSDLEWDVKGYFALNGAVHNAAIVAWDNKFYDDYTRPISMIRYMGGLGQSTDAGDPSYNPNGLPLEPGLVEIITAASTAPGQRHEALAGHEGEIAIRAWLGHPAVPTDTGGVGWMLATEWLPYQLANFVTPAFPGYTSGHSTFSRASAEVLAAYTGSEFFPGGIGEFSFPANTYLKFEGGPSADLTLQWATYFDASDQAGLSRLFGGIHVAADDFDGRITGSLIGQNAYALAENYFVGVPEPSTWVLTLTGLLALAGSRLRARRRRVVA